MAYLEPIKDPQNPNAVDYSPETPHLSQVFLDALRAHEVRLRVSLPACVTDVSGTQKVDVQPTLQVRYSAAAGPSTMPIIKNVPVCLPMGAKYSLKVPISVGDCGLVVFCDRSLDVWTQGDGKSPVDPADSRTHDISDPVFFPGLVPFGEQVKDSTDDMVLTAGSMSLRLQQSGKVKLASAAPGGQELLDLVNQVLKNQIDLLNLLSSGTYTLTVLGPQPFIASTLASLQQLSATAKKIASDLGTLKV